jgi:hypothetical protein
MTYEFRKATRSMVKLLIGLSGGTGSGKTWTSLVLAKGLSGGKRFGLIDTENGRASMYADFFDFDVLEITAPFTPDNYFDAIKAAEKRGYPVIVVDQFSHEWEGEGGILDEQLRIVDEMVERSKKAGDTRADWQLAESHNMRAWAEAKAPHKRMMTHLTQMNCHLILNYRAEDKIELAKEKDARGNLKTVIRPKQSATGTDGWIPICERRMPFELTTSVLFKSDKPGVPIPIKLQEQHKKFFPGDRALTEADGVALAAWASGITPTVKQDGITRDQALDFTEKFNGALIEKLKPVGKTLLSAWLKKQGLEGLSGLRPEYFTDTLEAAVQYAKEQV